MPIIDSHCHIYPTKIAARAVEGIRNFYDMDLGGNGTVEALLSEGKKAGVTHFLVHSVSTTPKQVQSINEFLANTVREYPDELIGFGSLHPDSEDIRGDLKNLVDLGLRGVKLHPDFQSFEIDSLKAKRLCYLIMQENIPVLIHGGDIRYSFSNPPQIKRFLESLPGLTVIGAHFAGWSCWEKAADELAGFSNLYVDCSSSLYALKPEVARRIIRKFGADKVLFGTDYPMWDVNEELRRLHALGLTQDEEDKILYKNADKLFKVKGLGV